MSRPLSFRHVETIYAVVLTGSVTGGAARLHVTQPAVSNLLREAEERLEFPLFERHAGLGQPRGDRGRSEPVVGQRDQHGLEHPGLRRRRPSATSQKASSPKLTWPIRSAVRSWPSSLIWSAVEVPSEVGKDRPSALPLIRPSPGRRFRRGSNPCRSAPSLAALPVARPASGGSARAMAVMFSTSCEWMMLVCL